MSIERRRQEAAILAAIEEAGPLRPGGIIAITGLGRKTVLKALRRMIATGSVRRYGSDKGTEYDTA